MSSKLVSITRHDTNEYEVILDIDGVRQAMLCRVFEHHGVRVVQPRPDLMSQLTFSPRLLAAAVLAFEAATDE
jgi:hypothetical protein